jgi:hypothetical protein
LSSQVFSGGWIASGVVGVVWWEWLHPATSIAANNRNVGFRIILETITGGCGNRNGARATLCGADLLICTLCPLAGRRPTPMGKSAPQVKSFWDQAMPGNHPTIGSLMFAFCKEFVCLWESQW